MKKLLIYQYGQSYVVGGKLSMQPSGIVPVKEYDLTELTDIELEELKKDIKNKKLLKKAIKIK